MRVESVRRVRQNNQEPRFFFKSGCRRAAWSGIWGSPWSSGGPQRPAPWPRVGAWTEHVEIRGRKNGCAAAGARVGRWSRDLPARRSIDRLIDRNDGSVRWPERRSGAWAPPDSAMSGGPARGPNTTVGNSFGGRTRPIRLSLHGDVRGTVLPDLISGRRPVPPGSPATAPIGRRDHRKRDRAAVREDTERTASAPTFAMRRTIRGSWWGHVVHRLRDPSCGSLNFGQLWQGGHGSQAKSRATGRFRHEVSPCFLRLRSIRERRRGALHPLSGRARPASA